MRLEGNFISHDILNYRTDDQNDNNNNNNNDINNNSNNYNNRNDHKSENNDDDDNNKDNEDDYEQNNAERKNKFTTESLDNFAASPVDLGSWILVKLFCVCEHGRHQIAR